MLFDSARREKRRMSGTGRNIITAALVTAAVFGAPGPSHAAENLTLRKGISYVTDTDSGFPIIASKLHDTVVEKGKATLIFFGASGDLNTNRQAKRVVSLYHRFKEESIKFIIVDIDHPQGEGTRSLIKRFYRGYIPSQILLDTKGEKCWEATGEAHEKTVEKEIKNVLAKTQLPE